MYFLRNNKVLVFFTFLGIFFFLSFFYFPKVRSHFFLKKLLEESFLEKLLYPFQEASPLKVDEAIIQSILNSMTLEEKVGQIFHTGIEGKTFTQETLTWLKKYKLGGVILFAGNFGNNQEIRLLNKNLQEASIQSTRIPLLISTDQEHGRVRRLGPEHISTFPAAMTLGQIREVMPIQFGKSMFLGSLIETLLSEVAFVTGFELRKLGINWVLAPVLDVNSNPKNPVINTRSMASDPYIVGELGKHYLSGNREALSLGVVKHFPGHGDTSVDSHLALPLVDKGLKEIQNNELLPFTLSIKAGLVDAVMCAHILFPALDQERPATLSSKIIKGILRKQMGYEGLVVSDAMEMKAVSTRYSPLELARLAMQAGLDIIIMSKQDKILKSMYETLLDDFRAGRLPISDLDQSVLRQLRVKWSRGLFIENEKQIGLSFIKNKKELERLWQRELLKSEKKHEWIQKKYKQSGQSLTTTLARLSITSLRKIFECLKKEDVSRVELYTQTKIMIEEARLMGIESRKIHTLQSPKKLWDSILRGDPSSIVMIELPSQGGYIQAWNKNIILVNKQKDSERISIIGLYTGSPFVNIAIPDKGALLTSFSDIPEAQAALVYRGLYPEGVIPQANLILDTYPREWE